MAPDSDFSPRVDSLAPRSQTPIALAPAPERSRIAETSGAAALAGDTTVSSSSGSTSRAEETPPPVRRADKTLVGIGLTGPADGASEKKTRLGIGLAHPSSQAFQAPPPANLAPALPAPVEDESQEAGGGQGEGEAGDRPSAEILRHEGSRSEFEGVGPEETEAFFRAGEEGFGDELAPPLLSEPDEPESLAAEIGGLSRRPASPKNRRIVAGVLGLMGSLLLVGLISAWMRKEPAPPVLERTSPSDEASEAPVAEPENDLPPIGEPEVDSIPEVGMSRSAEGVPPAGQPTSDTTSTHFAGPKGSLMKRTRAVEQAKATKKPSEKPPAAGFPDAP